MLDSDLCRRLLYSFVDKAMDGYIRIWTDAGLLIRGLSSKSFHPPDLSDSSYCSTSAWGFMHL